MGWIAASDKSKSRLTLPKRPSLQPAVVAGFGVLIAQWAITPSDYRILAVLAAMALSYAAGSRFGRAEQARELLRGQ